MKITISSPDGLGDFILRVPMIRALLEDGHLVQLFLRHPAAGLASEIFPDVERFEIGADPYHPDTRRRRNPFRAEQKAIRRFHPDLYVTALFALNFFDEVWFENDHWKVPVAGFSTRDAFWPSGTIADPGVLSENFRIKVEVPASLPELEKNRLLGSAIQGRDLPEVFPSLVPGEGSLAAARDILRLHGLKEGDYWIACVGSRSGLVMKDWGEENWRLFFSSVLPADGRPVVYLGNQKEWESIERIRAGNYRSINLAGDPPQIPISLALAAMSCGYAGRDSGVMHMTCAVRRPVLAAFGGGHWGRFLPSSGPAAVVTQATTCRMCDFACPHAQPLCITEISAAKMQQAWDELPRLRGVKVFEQLAEGDAALISGDEARRFALSEKARRLAAEAATRAMPWWRRRGPEPGIVG